MAEMTASQSGSLIISGAQVWDGIKQGFVERDLCIQDGLVADRPTSQETDGDPRIVDGAGKWVVPGLIDAHFHAYAVSMDGLENERGPLSFTALNGAKRLGAALKRGLTLPVEILVFSALSTEPCSRLPAISLPVLRLARPVGMVIRDQRWSTYASAAVTCARLSTVSTTCAGPSERGSAPERTP